MYIVCYETTFYKTAKAIRLGHEQASAEMQTVLNNIKTKYGVTAFHLEFSKEGSAVRADVMVDRYGDGQTIGYTNSHVKEELMALAKRDPKFADLEDLEVIYESFQRVATEEGYDLMKAQELPVFRNTFGMVKDLHTGARSFSVFFQTDAELSDEPLKKNICEWLFAALKKHDEFHYIEPDTFSVHFDSKENLNQNHKGDWSKYYR